MTAGRPSKYDSKYCEEIVKFFSTDLFYTITEVTSGKNWEKTSEKLIPNRLPTFERFAVNIGVHTDTLIEWTKQHEEFSVAYNTCKQLQKDFLIQNGLSGLYNAQFTQFVAKNITDMKDKVETENTHKVSGMRLVLGE